jgi:hypothetical protein
MHMLAFLSKYLIHHYHNVFLLHTYYKNDNSTV